MKTQNLLIMKRPLILIIILLVTFRLSSQTYYPFPTDTSQWNCLTIAQWSPSDILYINLQYKIQGDTLIGNKFYKKVFFNDSDNPPIYSEYIGGIREDSVRNIYFYPSMINLPNYSGSHFPSDTSEYLLYTFDSLVPGMTLPINTEVTEITVVDIDSILLNDKYRKRYKIQQNNLFGYDYWIEGIGSVKDLFAPFSYEFEWQLYTLCFSDTLTYYINSPNGEDSCHYALPLGVKEMVSEKTSIYPNPASRTIEIKSLSDNKEGIINIYNIQGEKILTYKLINSKSNIDISQLRSGLLLVEIITKNKKDIVKLIKK